MNARAGGASENRAAHAVVVLCSAWVCSACAAGAPVLHPVHALNPGELAASSGVSAHFAPPDAQRAIDRAAENAVTNGNDDSQVLVEGAVAQSLSTPGLAPWLAVRAGLVEATEGGVSYTGRRVRGDLRYVLSADALALSLGLGATGLMPNVGSSPATDTCDEPDYCPEVLVNDSYSEIPGFDGGSVSGWGLDMPVLVGWRSQPALLAVWGGLRPRFESLSGEFRFELPSGNRAAKASGSRVVFQGVVGIALGIKPIWALFELSPAFERLRGNVNLESEVFGASLEGFSLAPAIALMYAP